MQRPTSTWPNGRARRALLYVALLCAAVVAYLGWVVHDTVATWAVRSDRQHHFWGVPIDALPLSQLNQHHGAQLLVLLGEPQFFVAAIALLTIVSLIVHDRRLAYIAFVGPLSAELLTELILKPGIHRVAAAFYSYPSGHVTGTASIMAVLALLLRRTIGHRTAVIAAPLIALYVVGSMVGVIVLHMHDLIDAIGGLGVGIGVVSLWTFIALEWRSSVAPVSETSVPTSSPVPPSA